MTMDCLDSMTMDCLDRCLLYDTGNALLRITQYRESFCIGYYA